MWLSFVKNILTDIGFSYVWNNQGTFRIPSLLACVKTKLKERFVLRLTKSMDSGVGMDRSRTYKLVKQIFGIVQIIFSLSL